MTSKGTVTRWLDDEGWGVIESADTPGGCWTHYSIVMIDGYHSLAVGQRVEFDWAHPGQDGYPYRATQVWPEGAAAVAPRVEPAPTAAYTSHLTIKRDPN